MTLPLFLVNNTSLCDVEPWMFAIARSRPGMYTITVLAPDFILCPCEPWAHVVARQPRVDVNITGEEFAKLDKVIMNQTYAESKPKVQSAIVYQHASTIWPTHTPDDVTMRTLGAWAITQYRNNGSWLRRLYRFFPCLSGFTQKQVRLRLRQRAPKVSIEGLQDEDGREIDPRTLDILSADNLGIADNPTTPQVLSTTLNCSEPGSEDAGDNDTSSSTSGPADGPERNDLGFVQPGSGSQDTHPLGGVNADDSEIRAMREDRVVINAAGVGVVGQSKNPENPKQLVGVVGLPVSKPPNVYAKEADNVEVAIDKRIIEKHRPFTATKDDKILIGRVVSAAIGDNPRRGVFSARRVTDWWEKHLFADLKSGKWSDERLSRTVESLCQRIDPKFRLSCDIKIEPMPEGKAPRMLIADGDEGQVLALLSICCIEDLIKKHFPKKTIKGCGKRQAMERIATELRIPKAAYAKTKAKDKVGTVFEGDGSAFDATCSPELRDCVENPVILHVASILKVHMAQPASWVDAHSDISVLPKLALTFKKNGEFRKFVINAIRRSGHRGTSCLNWWENFVCWHCCIFECPELFLDPDVRYGVDHSGINRWLASGYEGDDSLLNTTPKIEEKDELYVSIMQRWERLGFNMKIFLRDKRALFTGYYFVLDKDGPTGVMMPEIDRCFARSGVSCSAAMIQYFKDVNKNGCQSVSRAAALSRAYEFAGCSPTISTKFLRYYESLSVKTHVDRDLQMRTCGGDAEFSEPDIITEINIRNGAAMVFDDSEHERLEAVGFGCTPDQLSQFMLRLWDYDLLRDWEGFRDSLPDSWRMP